MSQEPIKKLLDEFEPKTPVGKIFLFKWMNHAIVKCLTQF